MDMLVGKTFAEITLGQTASLTRTLTQKDILAFAAASGDANPAQLDAAYAAGSVFRDVIGHGLWTGALVSTLLGTQLPGPGSAWVSQSFSFKRPVRIGDTLTVTVTVREKKTEDRRVVLHCGAVTAHGDEVLEGIAEVIAPERPVRVPAPPLPTLLLPERGERLAALIEEAAALPPLRCAVAHPVDTASLGGALDAAEAGLIDPVFIGPKAKIEAAAKSAGFDLGGVPIIDVPHSHAAGREAARMAGAGEAALIMKGALHTDEILAPILDASLGLRTERRLSHCFVMDTPSYDKLLLVTDAAVNIAPDLNQKADILRNAAGLARALGIDMPKAAILCAVETVTASMPATLDAAALCKMADRGQIEGVIVDGPLAFDNAVSPEAAKTKGIGGRVAGEADILVVPDIEAGNMLAKQLDYLGGAVAAGIVLGARVPVVLTSRAEGRLPRLASCAVARLYHHRRHHGRPGTPALA